MSPVLSIAITTTLVLYAVAMAIGVMRLFRGPHAQDRVLVVKGERERLLPFVRGQVVVEVNLEQHLLRVDWDPDF